MDVKPKKKLIFAGLLAVAEAPSRQGRVVEL